MKQYTQQPRYSYSIIGNFLCDDFKKLQQFKTLISFKYAVSKANQGRLNIHRCITLTCILYLPTFSEMYA